MELNPEKDIEINVANLSEEFKKLPLLLFRYSEKKAEADYLYERDKELYNEARAIVFKTLKESGEKMTEKTVEAHIDTHPTVTALRDIMLQSRRDLETVKGFVESLKAKKEMLIQLGADARLEMK